MAEGLTCGMPGAAAFPAAAFPVAAVNPINNLPNRNRYFTGREDLLTKIYNALAGAHSAQLIGQGGFGKTQIAIEYAYRHRHEYKYVRYFNAESEQRFRDEYIRFSELIGFPRDMANDNSRVISYVKAWFENGQCLFIIDNAEGCSGLREYLPNAHPAGHILIISRERLPGLNYEMVNVQTFSPSDAVHFIQNRSDRISGEDARSLSEILGYLPLALEQAVSYINNNNYGCKEYIEKLQQYGLRLLDTPSTESDYLRTVTTTWNISFMKLESDARDDAKSKAAMQLLMLTAYCSPDTIPLRMFISERDKLPLPLRDILDPDNELGHNDLVNVLKNLSFISSQRNSGGILISIHRLIQAVINHNLQGNNEWLLHCFDVMVYYFDFEFGDKESFDKFTEVLNHAIQIAGHINTIYENDDEMQEKLAWLYNEFGYGLYKTGNYAAALDWCMKELDICEKVLCTEHPSTAKTYNNIALVYSEQGEYAKALEWHMKALAIREKVLGAEHPSTGTTYNNIALVYKAQGEYAEALEWHMKAYNVYRNKLGDCHPLTQTILSNAKITYDEAGYAEDFDIWIAKNMHSSHIE